LHHAPRAGFVGGAVALVLDPMGDDGADAREVPDGGGAGGAVVNLPVRVGVGLAIDRPLVAVCDEAQGMAVGG
jgi:hypothetical protein